MKRKADTGKDGRKCSKRGSGESSSVEDSHEESNQPGGACVSPPSNDFRPGGSSGVRALSTGESACDFQLRESSEPGSSSRGIESSAGESAGTSQLGEELAPRSSSRVTKHSVEESAGISQLEEQLAPGSCSRVTKHSVEESAGISPLEEQLAPGSCSRVRKHSTEESAGVPQLGGEFGPGSNFRLRRSSTEESADVSHMSEELGPGIDFRLRESSTEKTSFVSQLGEELRSGSCPGVTESSIAETADVSPLRGELDPGSSSGVRESSAGDEASRYLDLVRSRSLMDDLSHQAEAHLRTPCVCRLASLPLQLSLEGTSSGPNSNNNQSSCPDADTEFDWVWDHKLQAKSCIELSKNRKEVWFHTNYSLGTASARSNQPLIHGQNYWEIKMVSPVYGTDMMIGLGTCKVDPEKFTGQFCSMLGNDEQEESCGLSYLGDFYYGGRKRPFCGRFGQGAVIGVHLDLWTGCISYYKNGMYLGVACGGLKGREWYPMVSSTAAKSRMCLIRTASFPSSLQYLCARTLRHSVPDKMDVLNVLNMPPGLKVFLKNNLYWLLSAQSNSELEKKTKRTQGTQTRRRMSLELSVQKLGERGDTSSL